MLLRLPKIGMEMTEAVLTAWHADDGAAVEKGQLLYTLETEKVENDVDAPVAGILRRIAGAGATYEVGDEIAEIIEGAGPWAALLGAGGEPVTPGNAEAAPRSS
ncbi:MAG: lipoyl domain-containing protein [Acidimicrobiales bacterium]